MTSQNPTWRAFSGPLRDENRRHKSPIGTQKPLGIFAGSDYVPPTTPVQDPLRIKRVETRVSKARATPGERFQNAGRIERDGFKSCAARDRKANESLILRLKTYARKLGVN